MKTVVPLLASFFLLPLIAPVASREWVVYVGTYTRQSSRGIYAYRFTTDAKLVPLGLAAEVSNPSFLVVHPNHRYLYAVNENNAGTVTAFAIDEKTSQLHLLNSVSSRGGGPCHLGFDRTGKWLFVANYNNGSVASLPVRDNGTLGEAAASVQHSGAGVNPQRQSGPHAHSVNISPDNRFLAVTDLGLDQVLVYRFESKTGTLTANDPPFTRVAPGSGPRHLTFSSDGKFAWVLNEMTASVAALRYDKTLGRFTQLQTISALPHDYKATNSAAEILVHPSGRFLYTSNRGHNSIALFNIEPGGALSGPAAWTLTGGKTPRNFAIDPDGNYLIAANQDSNNLAVYRLDSKTGTLTAAGETVESPVPVSVVFGQRR